MADLAYPTNLVSPEADEALTRFRLGVVEEQRASLASGIAYPVTDADGLISWIHPDGSRRAGMAPESENLD